MCRQKSTLIHHFPSELMMEVFARLPVKSLLRFRCVSKNWLDLIGNPDLISLHLNHNINNHNINFVENFRFLTLENSFFTIRLLDKFKESAQLMKVPSSCWPLASNDGLILMLNDVSKELILVNPSVKKSLQLPTCPIPHYFLRDAAYAIGFASKSNDYKVVAFRLPNHLEDYVPSFAVYALRDDCWRTKAMDLKYNFRWSPSSVLSTKGAAHWFAYPLRGCYYNQVVSFDLNTERFSYVGLPDYQDGIHCKQMETNLYLFSLGGSVAILTISFLSTGIWVMNNNDINDGGEKQKSWTKLFSGGSSLFTFRFFYHCQSQKFWFDERSGNFYISVNRELWLYDIRGDEIEELGQSNPYVRHTSTYVESLLLC